MSFMDAFPKGFSEQDILFDCPECSKSLGIERRGAGLVIRCPDCGTRMRVPTPDRFDDGQEPAGAEEGVRTGLNESVYPPIEDQVHRLEVSLEELHRRKDYLERLRFSTEQHIEQLREELAVVQASLDRMVGILQNIVPDSSASSAPD